VWSNKAQKEMTMGQKRIWRVRVDGDEKAFTREDVRQYFSQDFRMDGMRSFGGVSGDWRMIDAIAHDARYYFGM
jgi:hypothetical protein